MIQNLSETEFHYVRKFVLTQQILKSPHLLRESGEHLIGAKHVKFYKYAKQ